MLDTGSSEWRFDGLLRRSADRVKPGSVHAIDATGCDRQGASRRYANRTSYRFTAVETSVLVDCETKYTRYTLFNDIIARYADRTADPRTNCGSGRDTDRSQVIRLFRIP